MSETEDTLAPTAPARVTALPTGERNADLRIIEALLFASSTPLSTADLGEHLSGETETEALIAELQTIYAQRGVNVVKVGGRWVMRTAEDLGFLLAREQVQTRRLSRAALETLAIIAYHQPCTRAEIEEIRGVSTSKGTLDVLLETGWVRLRGRRRAPGRPVTYGTTDAFLEHFGLETVKDLPGLDELKGAGLLSANLPPDFQVPLPSMSDALDDDELPLEDEEEPEFEALDLDDKTQGEEEQTTGHSPDADRDDTTPSTKVTDPED